MKANTPITVLRGKLANYKGFTAENHRNAPDLIWCWLSQEAPFPTVGQSKPLNHHVLRALHKDSLQAL